ncbi:hypothetical protein FA13DRAFT_1818573 [Coprinellus micaceus]|uniref:Nephrocystin 3-like N-terminal domain-containing protein n=1 Tax=Coprinellus micaceus TaxID=71717 RepID=A0A4Y7SPF0_COPMI|nr:hypothetical protein FA13DRAFT_1818573 [Coprinellus micaceus]
MLSPFSKFGRNIKSLFQSRSRDGHSSTDHPGVMGDGVASSSAPPPMTTSSISSVILVTPTLRMVNDDPSEPQIAALSQALAHPSSASCGHRNAPDPRISPRAAVASGSGSPLSSAPDAILLYDDRTSTPLRWDEPPVHGPRPASRSTRSPPTPSMRRTSYGAPFAPTRPSSGPSCFSNAHDFAVSNLTINHSAAYSKTLFEYLNPHIAHGAAHDSDERWNAPSCHEETRIAIREDIVSWIKHGEGDEEPKRMLWLSGPAGCGKTAIAGSIAETCKEDGLLAATFFFSSFSGSADRSSKWGLIATLAYHMSQVDALHQYKSHLHAAVDRQPNIFRKNLKEQAKCLILEPFRKIRYDQENRAGWPKVVIIDGLDEVVAEQHPNPTDQQSPSTSEDDQVGILHVLLNLSKDPFFPFRIFVASRPEHNIADFFSTDAPGTAINLFLDSQYEPDADIRRFLESRFAGIRRRTGILSASWPGDKTLNRLVEMSSGQFIVPTTIIRWVEAGVPQLQMAEVMRLDEQNAGKANPFATLDALYRHILQRAHTPDDDPHLVVQWIKCITSAMFVPPIRGPPCANFWRLFLGDVEGELTYRLGPITSLISVPPPNDTSSPITIYHKSLTDFLSSPTRCGDLYADSAGHTSFISERIFVVLKNKGPVVPIPSLPNLATFLSSFFLLNLLWNMSPEALTCLSESSKAERDCCDVAWWATACLSDLLSDGSSLSQDGYHTELSENWGTHSWLVQLIYHRIHQAMGCGSEAPSVGQDAARQAHGPKCHVVCVRWRTGILAKAKEAGWCVHELEAVQLNELGHLDHDDIHRMFKPPEKRPCRLCKLASTRA